MNLATRRRRNLLITLAIAIGLYCVHWIYNAALYNAAFLSGWALFISILFLTLYNLRKKITMLPIGSNAAWLQLHIYLGWLVIFLFVLHIGWRVPDGLIEVTLAILFIVVAGTGVLGILLSRTLPKRLTRRGEEIIVERTPIFLARLREEAEQIVIISASETGSNTIRDFYAEHLHFYFRKPRNFLLHLISSNRGVFKLQSEFNNTDRYLNAAERELFGKLRTLVVKKDDIDFQYALQTMLKAWLLIHIPVTYALILLAVLHLVIVHAYSSGLG